MMQHERVRETTPSASALDQAYRKISWRLLPVLMAMWTLAWIDRTNIGFARLQMVDDLKFSDAVYGLGAGIFFIGYFIFEVPSNLLLQKIGARKTITRIAIGWGITCMATMFVTTPVMFYLLRFLLGAFEAGFNPGVLFFLAAWYPTNRRAKAYALFGCSVNIAGVIGGPLAGTLMTRFTGVGGILGWQWVFLIEGVLSVIVGGIAIFMVTDRLDQATWLNESERGAVRDDLARDRSLLGPRDERMSDALRDGRVWLLTAIYFCAILANAAAAFWGPTILRDAGFNSPATIGWIFSAISLIGIVVMLANGVLSDRAREARYHFVVPLLLCALGIAVLASAGPGQPMLVLGAFAVALIGITAAIPVFWQLPNMILTGAAAALSIAIINSVGNLGGFVAPYALGLAREMTGRVSLGLWGVAVLDVLAAIAIIVFVPALRGGGAARR